MKIMITGMADHRERAQAGAERVNRIASSLYLMCLGLNQAGQCGEEHRERALKAAPLALEWLADQAEEAATDLYCLSDDLEQCERAGTEPKTKKAEGAA